jgi:diaminopimelate epimerase
MRSTFMLGFSKYHALGNDYLVIEANCGQDLLTPETVRQICHRHFGIGSDGILVRLPPQADELFRLRIWNPDGTEAEKSGNGLRVFARYLWDRQCVGSELFTVATAGGAVTCRVEEHGRSVSVDMGEVSFDSRRIPVQGPPRDVLREMLVLDRRAFEYSAATIGNPHCVLLRDRVSTEEARSLGPLVEMEPRFPNRTNVQFVQVLDRHNIVIEIWERGAGYTLASGSSSCAAAAVVVRLGLCDSPLTVHMSGGSLSIEIDKGYRARMIGPVCKVAEGTLCGEAWQGLTERIHFESFALVPFEARYADTVRGWVVNREEMLAWAGLDDHPLDSSIFTHWHADPEVHGSVLVRDGIPIGYGEVWENFENDAVELARLIVAPSYRGCGVARVLIERLCASSPATTSKRAVLRIRPGNMIAIRCYERAGFRHVSSDQERVYNTNQPVEYIWMCRTIGNATERFTF